MQIGKRFLMRANIQCLLLVALLCLVQNVSSFKISTKLGKSKRGRDLVFKKVEAEKAVSIDVRLEKLELEKLELEAEKFAAVKVHECELPQKAALFRRLIVLEEMATTHNISHALTWFSDGDTLTEADEEAIRHDFANGIKLKLRRLTHACQIVIEAVNHKKCVQGEKLYNSGCVECGEGSYQDSNSHTSTSCKKCTATCRFGKSHSCSKTSGAAIVSLFLP